MARTIEQILKQQFGNLIIEIATLTAANEQLRERVTELEGQSKSTGAARDTTLKIDTSRA